MHDFLAIMKIPNRLNIEYMLKSKFNPLIDTIVQNGMKAIMISNNWCCITPSLKYNLILLLQNGEMLSNFVIIHI